MSDTPTTHTTHRAESKSMFEKLYQKERKKSKLLMVTALVLAVLLVGSWAYGVSRYKTITATRLPGTMGQNDGVGPGGFGGPGGQGRPNLSPKAFLKSDGSVDTDRVKSMIDNVPTDFKSRLLSRIATQIDNAVASGDITQVQADALKSAFGTTGSMDNSSGNSSGTL